MVISRHLLLSVIFFGAALFIFTEDTFAQVRQGRGYRGTGASVSETAAARCVVGVDSKNVDAFLADQGVRVQNATPAEKQKIASAIRTIMSYSGPGMGGAFRNLNVIVRENLTGASGRAIAGFGGAGQVTLSRQVFTIGNGNRSNAYSESTVVHELGHTLANRRGLYGKYNSAVPERCTVSTYCTHRVSVDGRSATPHRSRNEEFAEVFAAYFFNPQELKRKCPASFAFLNEKVFRSPTTEAVACQRNGFHRGYQRADGQMVDIVGGGTAPTSGTPVYVNFNTWWQQLTGRVPIDKTVPHDQEQEDEYERLTRPARSGGGSPVTQ